MPRKGKKGPPQKKKAPKPNKFKAKPVPKGLLDKKPDAEQKAAIKPRAAAAAAAK